MSGPGPRGGHGGKGRMGFPMQKPQNVGKTIKRIVKYLTEYKALLVAVIFCILFSSAAMILNDYIVPFIGQQNPDLSKFLCSFSSETLQLPASRWTIPLSNEVNTFRLFKCIL